MPQTQLFVTDNGDYSVGMPELTYVVDCPVIVNDINNLSQEEQRELERFRGRIIDAFSEQTEYRVTADYDFETIDVDGEDD